MPDTEKTYGTVVTSAGLALVTAATMRGEKVKLKYLAVGDGGGQYYQPSADMTALKNEKWRGEVNSVQINPDSPNMIDVVAVVPATVGGFTIREMSVQTEDDDIMFAVCNTPDTEKVIITTGAAGEVELTMHIEVANAANVTIAVDPNVVTATKTDLKNHNADPDAHGGVLPRLEAIENSVVPIYAGTAKPTADGPFLWLQVIQQGGDADPDPDTPDGPQTVKLDIQPMKQGSDLYVKIDEETKSVDNAEKQLQQAEEPLKIKLT